MTRPAHLFLADCGDLHDTRNPNWSRKPLRPRFARHSRDIASGRDLRAALRVGPCAWPGGYACYFVADDGAVLSFEAVQDNLAACIDSIRNMYRDGWRIVAMATTAECDDMLACDRTGRVIFNPAE